MYRRVCTWRSSLLFLILRVTVAAALSTGAIHIFLFALLIENRDTSTLVVLILCTRSMRRERTKWVIIARNFMAGALVFMTMSDMRRAGLCG